MADIEVRKLAETDTELEFEVEVREAGSRTRHVVTVQRSDVDADRFPDPGELVHSSFEFLLERESKESILARFDLRDITTYFPEFDRDLLHRER
jgi:hypothetical protein